MKFTEGNVIELKAPAGKADHWEPDDSLPGFGIRFRAGEPGVYGIRYGFAGRDRRLAYQRVGKVKLADARTWAKQQFATVAGGTDPGIERKQAKKKTALEDLINDFIEHQRNSGRSGTHIYATDRSLKRYFKALHSYGIGEINRAMVAEELRRIRKDHGPVAADRAAAHLSKFYGWAQREGLCEANPASNTNKNGTGKRDRVLSAEEIKTIWHALGDGDYADIIKLLLLTGCRKTEIGALVRAEINMRDKQIELPAERTKNRRPHIVPPSPMALAILQKRALRNDSDFVFGQGAVGFNSWTQLKGKAR
jgi:integrase